MCYFCEWLNRDRCGGYFLLKICNFKQYYTLNVEPWCSFFELGLTPCNAEQPLWDMELQEKEAQKDYSIHKICSEKTYSYKMSVNSRLKANKIICQRKAFYRQGIPQPCCARKNCWHDILVTSRNGDRKIMQSE